MLKMWVVEVVEELDRCKEELGSCVVEESLVIRLERDGLVWWVDDDEYWDVWS